MHNVRKTWRKAIAALATGVIGFAGLTSCSDENSPEEIAKQPQFGYVLPRPLETTNAGSVVGNATDAAKLSARLYPGAYVTGPAGQLLPNKDLVTAKVDPHSKQKIYYKINSEATYSDGASVVCDDFWMARLASERNDAFASDLPLFAQVESIACKPGSREFQVMFKPGFGTRYQELFSAGTVLPSHTVAEKAGVESFMDAANSDDEKQLFELGKAWQDVFNLKKTNPAEVPTFGPYTVGERLDGGGLVLTPNPHWKGDKPGISRIHVRGSDANLAELVANNQLSVLDAPIQTDLAAAGVASENFNIRREPSDRTDTLRLSGVGTFEAESSRHALNSCIDRSAIANTVAESSKNRVLPTGLRTVPPTAPMTDGLEKTNAANMVRNVEEARQNLDGATVRIGYLKDVVRYQKIIDTMKTSCAEAGITIEPVPVTADDYGQLGQDYDAILDTRSPFSRNSGSDAGRNSLAPEVMKAEHSLQASMFTIPLVAEPRVIAYQKNIDNVVDNPGDVGLSWNMDRWVALDHPVPSTDKDSAV